MRGTIAWLGASAAILACGAQWAAPLVLAQDRAPRPDLIDAIKKRAEEEARRALDKARPADAAPADTKPKDNAPADSSTRPADVAPDPAATRTPDSGNPKTTDSAAAVEQASDAVTPSLIEEATNTKSPADSGAIIMRNIELPVHTNTELLLFLRDDGSRARDLTQEHGLDLVSSQRIGLLGLDMVLVKLRGGDSVNAALGRINGDRRLAWAQPNYIYQLLGNSRTRGLAMHGLGPDAALLPQGLPALGPKSRIALIDSPVDSAHPALAGADIRQLGSLGNVAPAPHGTAIAELLVGTGEFEGVVRGAQLISIPAFQPAPTPAQPAAGTSTTHRLMAAFQLADDSTPDVLNLSFGTLAKHDEGTARMIDALHAKGVCVAAAAGNGGADSPVLFPASLATTIAVAAVDATEQAYPFGSRGSQIDIAAWGVDISAAVPGGRRAVSGTSFATPLVAGAMLRMPACSTHKRPANIRLALALDAKDLGEIGQDAVFGAGLLQFGKNALASDRLDPALANSPAPVSGRSALTLWLGGAALVLGGALFFLFGWRRRQQGDSAKD